MKLLILQQYFDNDIYHFKSALIYAEDNKRRHIIASGDTSKSQSLKDENTTEFQLNLQKINSQIEEIPVEKAQN